MVTIVVKDKNGTEVETAKKTTRSRIPIGPWSVKLKNPLKKDYTITAYQEYNPESQEYDDDYANIKSAESVPVTVQRSTADDYMNDDDSPKLTMSEFEVWSEDVHVLDEDAKTDIINKFKESNSSVPFDDVVNEINVSGNGQEITVKFKDGSSLTVNPSQLTVHKITERSAAPEIAELKVTANTITGKLSGNGPFSERTKVGIVLNFTDVEKGTFCNDEGCKIDESTTVWAQVDAETGTFTHEFLDFESKQYLKIGNDIGVVVKEYRKLANCGIIKPVIAKPEPVEVRDPKKLTDDDKKKIDAAIRSANKVNGTSKCLMEQVLMKLLHL